MKYSLIVPTYNEKDNILAVLQAIEPAARELGGLLEVLVVDDDSPDGTAEVARSYTPHDFSLSVIVRQEDKGLSQAVIAGFDAAKGDYMAVMDADLSHPPSALPRLFASLEQGASLAVGSRYVPDGATVDWPWHRQAVSRIAAWLARPLTPIKDPTSGFFAIRRSVLDAHTIVPRGYKIALEFIARVKAEMIVEVPITFRDRTYGESKLGWAVVLAYIIQLAALYRERNPHLIGYFQFGMVGLIGLLADSAVFSLIYWYMGAQNLGPQLGGWVAQTISFLFAVQVNYHLNRVWTFHSRSRPSGWQWFLLISIGGYVLRSIVFALLIGALGSANFSVLLPYEQWSLFIAIIAASIWNYYGSQRWVFPESTRRPEVLPAPTHLLAMGAWGLAFSVYAGLILFFAWVTPLAYDEAYYWQWSRHLDWGYFDHPPLIAYLIWGGTRLIGDTELGIRLLPIVLSLGAWLLLINMTQRIWGNMRAALWCGLFLLTIPLYSVGSMFATPDIPLLFFWAATLVAFDYVTKTDKPMIWVLIGLLAGTGFLAKYPMLLLWFALFVSLWLTADDRKHLRRPGPYIALGIALALSLPMLVWNWRNDFASFAFQFGHGFTNATSSSEQTLWIDGLKRLLEYIGAQVGVVSPLWFAVAFMSLWWFSLGKLELRVNSQRTVQASERNRILIAAWLPIIAFAIASLFSKSEANWPAPAYLAISITVGGWMVYAANSVWKRRLAYAGVVLGGLLSLYSHMEAAFHLIPYKSGVMVQTMDRRPMAEWAGKLAEQHSADRLIANNYKLASILSFYIPGQPMVDNPFEKGSGSSYLKWWRDPADDETLLYFTDKEHDHRLNKFTKVKRLDSFTEKRQERSIRTIYAYHVGFN